jgi:hypothetical protein
VTTDDLGSVAEESLNARGAVEVRSHDALRLDVDR